MSLLEVSRVLSLLGHDPDSLDPVKAGDGAAETESASTRLTKTMVVLMFGTQVWICLGVQERL